MNNSLNPEIEVAIGPLIQSLAAQAIAVIESHVSNSFGNFVVHFRGTPAGIFRSSGIVVSSSLAASSSKNWSKLVFFVHFLASASLRRHSCSGSSTVRPNNSIKPTPLRGAAYFRC